PPTPEHIRSPPPRINTTAAATRRLRPRHRPRARSEVTRPPACASTAPSSNVASEENRCLMSTEDTTQGVADFTQRHTRSYGIEDGGQQIFSASGDVLDGVERAPRRIRIPCPPKL